MRTSTVKADMVTGAYRVTITVVGFFCVTALLQDLLDIMGGFIGFLCVKQIECRSCILDALFRAPPIAKKNTAPDLRAG